jgi:hypothetical protein
MHNICFCAKGTKKKLDPRFVKAIFVGYSAILKTYQLWNPIKKQIIIYKNVFFHEKKAPIITIHMKTLVNIPHTI